MIVMMIIEILIAAFFAFILGGIWYSKKVFGNIWAKADGKDPKKYGKSSHKVKVFISAGVLYIVSAFFTYCIIGPQAMLMPAIFIGFLTGLGFVATSFGINYLFAGRSLTLFWIDAGYHVLQFTLYGLIFGLFGLMMY